MPHALQQTNAVGVICQGASSAPHFLLARLQGVHFSTCFPITYSFSCTPCVCPLCLLQTAFRKLSSYKRGILTGISWDFFGHIKCSLNVNKANGMLTSNAGHIFCDNVTCFATNKSCSSRSHLSGCFKCSSLLACKAARVQLSTCFPIT